MGFIAGIGFLDDGSTVEKKFSIPKER